MNCLLVEEKIIQIFFNPIFQGQGRGEEAVFVHLCIDLASPPLILPRLQFFIITLVCLMSGGVEVCV